MRAFACALAASFLLAAAPGFAASPQRAASLNLCTDEYLLLLAAPDQIASVTHLSHDPDEAPWWRAARRHPHNDGSLLSVAPHRPDLILTMGGVGRDRAGLAGRIGARIVDLPFPQSIDDIAGHIRLVAHALGRADAARPALAALAQLRRRVPPLRDAAFLAGSGRSVAADGLGAEWMALAGYRQRRLAGDRLTLETLLADPPPYVLRSTYRRGQFSGEQRWLSHPLAARVAASREIATDGRRWTCMGPSLISEIRRLRHAS